MQLILTKLVIVFLLLTNSLLGYGQDYWSQIRNRCQNYGYKDGSDQFSQCIQKLDSDARLNQSNQHNQRCRNIASYIHSCSQYSAQRPPSLGFINGIEIVGAGDYAEATAISGKQRQMCLQAQEDFLKYCR